MPCRLTLELHERQGRVDVLTTKYEALAAKGRATDHEGGEPKSQAYYVIKVITPSQRAAARMRGGALVHARAGALCCC